MNEPLFHKRTLFALNNYLARPTHGLIISAPEGSGRLFTAKWLASNMAIPSIVVEPEDEKKQISIQQIRELYNLTRTGTPLAVIVTEAESMSQPAQNAFLKLLEEPPKNTFFILTVSKDEKLLSTIKSRAQVIQVNKLEKASLTGQIKIKYPDLTDVEIESLIITADYKIGSIIKLLDDRNEFTNFKTQIDQCKKFYSANKYTRHLICIENNFETNWLSGLLKTLSVIIESLLIAQASNVQNVKRLSAQAEVIQEAAESIFKYPGNPKIHISKLIEYL